jgi:hypothetical protein
MNAGGSTRTLLTIVLLTIAGQPAIAAAQTAADQNATQQDPLAARQQIARDRMVQLEDRMYRLIEKLSAGEPEQAKRLEEALRRARELLIRRQMDEAIDLLNQGDLATAADKESAVTKGLEELLAILLAEADRREQIKKETDRLRAFDEKIKELIERQSQLHQQLDPASAPASPDTAAPKQRDLQADTGQLARQMQAHPPQSRPEESKDPRQDAASRPHNTLPPDQPPNDTQPAPGAENVQQAEQHMNDAADKLDARQTEQARADQQKALDQLEQARRQLQETLDQLRREQQEEILRSLESRFRAMLARQEAANTQTANLDARGPSKWTHADELTLAGLAQEENSLADEAAEALHILEEEGTTIVFPQVVKELRDDLLQVAGLLKARQTGPETARLQTDIVDLLKELITAVQEMRNQLQAGAGQGLPGQMNRVPPLLPGSAELKMLRSWQLRINRLTEQLSTTPAGAPTTDQADQIRDVSERQRNLAEMARKMNERISGQ